MSNKYTQHTLKKGPGNGFEPRSSVLCAAPRVCATCGAPLVGRRRQTRFCCPTCRAADYDRRHNRTTHAAKGGEV